MNPRSPVLHTSPSQDSDRQSLKAQKSRSPIIDFTRIIFNHRPDARYLPRVLLYYLKFAFFEPFRQLEKIIYEKKIKEWQLKRDPLIILGYYRSGTTHLQEVLLEDTQFAYMNFYQCFFQNGFLVTERFFKGIFNWIITKLGYMHPAHKIPFKFSLPGEEDVSMVASGFELATNWAQVVPKSFKQIYKKTAFYQDISYQEQLNFELEYETLVKRLSIANRNKQLLLKSPPHTSRLEMLRRIFPNAKFIFIYRDPYYVYKSNQKLWGSFSEQWLQDISTEEANKNVLWAYNESHEKYEKDKQSVPQEQLIEIKYETFMKAPMEQLELIYKQLNLGNFQDVKARFSAYLEAHHGANVAQYKFNAEDLQLVETHWKKWLDRWGYSKCDNNAQDFHSQKDLY